MKANLLLLSMLFSITAFSEVPQRYLNLSKAVYILEQKMNLSALPHDEVLAMSEKSNQDIDFIYLDARVQQIEFLLQSKGHMTREPASEFKRNNYSFLKTRLKKIHNILKETKN